LLFCELRRDVRRLLAYDQRNRSIAAMEILTKNEIKGLSYHQKKQYNIDLKAHKRKELEDVAQDQPLLVYLFISLCSIPLVCVTITVISFLISPIFGMLAFIASFLLLPSALWDIYRHRWPKQPKQPKQPKPEKLKSEKRRAKELAAQSQHFILWLIKIVLVPFFFLFVLLLIAMLTNYTLGNTILAASFIVLPLVIYNSYRLRYPKQATEMRGQQ
jgi:hypothetical protein